MTGFSQNKNQEGQFKACEVDSSYQRDCLIKQQHNDVPTRIPFSETTASKKYGPDVFRKRWLTIVVNIVEQNTTHNSNIQRIDEQVMKDLVSNVEKKAKN